MNFTVTEFEDWQILAEFVKANKKHNLILLKGNLGAGKTTFTKYLLKNFGVKDDVSSPTYSIVNEYDTDFGKIFHFDLYRLKSAEEAEDFGFYEYFENGAVCIIEWPEIVEDYLEDYPHHTLRIENLGEKREINFI